MQGGQYTKDQWVWHRFASRPSEKAPIELVAYLVSKAPDRSRRIETGAILKSKEKKQNLNSLPYAIPYIPIYVHKELENIELHLYLPIYKDIHEKCYKIKNM